MTSTDVTLLVKKIVIGIIVTLVPFIILFGGLWLIQKSLTNNTTEETSTHVTK